MSFLFLFFCLNAQGSILTTCREFVLRAGLSFSSARNLALITSVCGASAGCAFQEKPSLFETENVRSVHGRLLDGRPVVLTKDKSLGSYSVTIDGVISTKPFFEISSYDVLGHMKARADGVFDYATVIDHSHIWRNIATDQKCLETCHIFAAVALAEAALFRITGKHYDLSEKDLFYLYINSYFPKWDQDNPFGGHVSDDWSLLVTNGVCLEKTRPYDIGGSALEYILSSASPLIYGRLRSYEDERQNGKPISPEVVIRDYEPSSDVRNEREEIKKLLSTVRLFEVKPTPSQLLDELARNPVAISVSDYLWLGKSIPLFGGRHATLLVGYDPLTNELLVRNSWNEWWPDRIDLDELYKNGHLTSIYYFRIEDP
ncbi:MAG: C1 family peptidase [Bacteriovoracia bacterium]